MIRCCLSLEVIPVFTPPNEMGFQAAIESFNGRWQSKVWSRREYTSVGQLQNWSAKYIEAARTRAAARIEAAPPRTPIAREWRLDLQAPPDGMIIYLRRTDDRGQARLLGRTFPVDRQWPHRLVRAEVDLTNHQINFYALRRRTPEHQPLLHSIPYEMPNRRFKE